MTIEGPAVAATDLDLAAAIERAQAHALGTGALLPVVVEGEAVEADGLTWRIEWMSALAMKDLMSKIPRVGDRGGSNNPFLPFEQDLHVADLSATHVAILNKFQARAGHLVLITRAYVEQDTPLTLADFEACALALGQIGGFAFFNSGPVSGASQTHRHLQVMPGFEAPIEAVLPSKAEPYDLHRAPGLTYEHLYSALPPGLFDDPAAAADRLLSLNEAACAYFGLDPIEGRRPPYNLLFTRDWFIIVPRREECAAGVSMSALTYSGLVGLRSQDQIEAVKAFGPGRMLTEGAGKPPSPT